MRENLVNKECTCEEKHQLKIDHSSIADTS